MTGKERLFLLLGGVCFVYLLVLGFALTCTDLGCGMFFYYKDGGIYSCKTDRRLMDDTPANRRRISRGMGLFLIIVDWLVFGVLAAVRFF